MPLFSNFRRLNSITNKVNFLKQPCFFFLSQLNPAPNPWKTGTSYFKTETKINWLLLTLLYVRPVINFDSLEKD